MSSKLKSYESMDKMDAQGIVVKIVEKVYDRPIRATASKPEIVDDGRMIKCKVDVRFEDCDRKFILEIIRMDDGDSCYLTELKNYNGPIKADKSVKVLNFDSDKIIEYMRDIMYIDVKPKK